MIKNGKIWPIFIAVAIFGVVLLGYWTIKETAKADLKESDIYMSYYQDVDDKINDIIAAKIAFNKHYQIQKALIDLSNLQSPTISYKITTVDQKPVNNASLELVISRPDSSVEEIKSKNYSVQDGIYTFHDIKLPKEGRWDLMLKVQVGEYHRFYNLKADTRAKENFEF